LLTPTFIRRGDDSRGTLQFRDLVDDLLRRISLLSRAYGDGPVHRRHEELAMTDATASVAIEDAAVRWMEVPRFSRNQRQAMTFGGWMGWVRYAVDAVPWFPLLRAAELLHVGKHTTFGFGAVEFS
jgi:CRISPR/Cas system endoribonuclease Cas6 (RAMP superfamily)